MYKLGIAAIPLLERKIYSLSDINPQISTCIWDFLLILPGNQVANTLVGGVKGIQGVEIVDNRSKNQWRVDGRKGEVWLLLFDEFPCGAFGESFCSKLLE